MLSCFAVVKRFTTERPKKSDPKTPDVAIQSSFSFSYYHNLYNGLSSRPQPGKGARRGCENSALASDDFFYRSQIYNRVDVYPLVACIGVALSFCVYKGSEHLLVSRAALRSYPSCSQETA